MDRGQKAEQAASTTILRILQVPHNINIINIIFLVLVMAAIITIGPSRITVVFGRTKHTLTVQGQQVQ